MRSRIVKTSKSRGQTYCSGSEYKDHYRRGENGQHHHPDFAASYLLAEVFGRSPDHKTSDEDSENDHQDHSVHSRTNAAENHFAELHVDDRDESADGRKRIVHRVYSS